MTYVVTFLSDRKTSYGYEVVAKKAIVESSELGWMPGFQMESEDKFVQQKLRTEGFQLLNGPYIMPAAVLSVHARNDG